MRPSAQGYRRPSDGAGFGNHHHLADRAVDRNVDQGFDHGAAGLMAAARAPDPFCRALRPDPFEIRSALIEMRSRFAVPYGEDLVGKLELVVAEILNNIAEHGGETPPRCQTGDACGTAGRVLLSVAHAEGGLFCIVCDDGDAVPGACFAQGALPRKTAGPVETLPEGGFGWPLICEMTENLYYRPDNGHNVLAFLVPGHNPLATA